MGFVWTSIGKVVPSLRSAVYSRLDSWLPFITSSKSCITLIRSLWSTILKALRPFSKSSRVYPNCVKLWRLVYVRLPSVSISNIVWGRSSASILNLSSLVISAAFARFSEVISSAVNTTPLDRSLASTATELRNMSIISPFFLFHRVSIEPFPVSLISAYFSVPTRVNSSSFS